MNWQPDPESYNPADHFKVNQTYQGTVKKVYDIGAYVDIGGQDDAFLHMYDAYDGINTSQMEDISDYWEVEPPVATGDIIRGLIKSIDGRAVSLTCVQRFRKPAAPAPPPPVVQVQDKSSWKPSAVVMPQAVPAPASAPTPVQTIPSPAPVQAPAPVPSPVAPAPVPAPASAVPASALMQEVEVGGRMGMVEWAEGNFVKVLFFDDGQMSDAIPIEQVNFLR